MKKMPTAAVSRSILAAVPLENSYGASLNLPKKNRKKSCTADVSASTLQK